MITAQAGKEDEAGTYVAALAALLMAGYVMYVRMARLRASGTFDRSLRGDLDQAISDTRHRVRISKLTLWYIPFIAAVFAFQYWLNEKPVWAVALVISFFVIAFLAGRMEHKKLHLGRLQELEQLKEELNEKDL